MDENLWLWTVKWKSWGLKIAIILFQFLFKFYMINIVKRIIANYPKMSQLIINIGKLLAFHFDY